MLPTFFLGTRKLERNIKVKLRSNKKYNHYESMRFVIPKIPQCSCNIKLHPTVVPVLQGHHCAMQK